MTNRPLNRREFTRLAAVSLSAIPATLTMSHDAAAQNAPARTVKFRDGKTVPALGQGSARIIAETFSGDVTLTSTGRRP